MKRPLLLLAVLVALLAAADALLGAREARRRAARVRVGSVFSADEAAELRKQPALRLELAGQRHAYGRIDGQWRCLTLHQAPVDGAALQAWLDALVGAEGVVQTRGTDEAPAYGINTPTTIRVELQGPRATQDPGGDVRATLELGTELATGTTFLRRKGTREVWAVAGELRAPLERRRAPGLAPLLAPAVVPGAWTENGGTLRVVVSRPGGGFTLERRERTHVPADAGPGLLPWTWVLVGAEEREPAPAVAEAYVGLLEQLPYVAVLAPEERVAAGVDAPSGTVTLGGRDGSTLVLAWGTPTPAGTPLWVAATQTLYRVETRLLELALPAPEALLDSADASNPWSTALDGPNR